ncbi:uracil-DNA glycosylase family protein [Cyanobacterium aponinum AL20118]|uniref:Uracil-DNA glycosylase superfamily n=2 Tax=Cyanobacterium aponinum TaxID=379064 RepID=K9Z550_CYAAP|nr:uracil-DNA glycosylase family protein [Cyanobacterium aponinum]AFZ54306.1 Uracil-DNA glycosylase superfamily [Cyanobacterium aponinum PCC 10605]WPF89028.1 uracil-DNA glycosylase family protein [Cyanobacterium aponinum AL20115]
MQPIENLIDQIQKEAQREEFPIDIPVYKNCEKDPTKPILYYGNLKSNICFFGRDLGRDEVKAGQPLIGAAGQLVRQGFYKAIYQEELINEEKLASIKERLILTNTVPYKPPENKAYAMKVKKRFRPFIEQLLVIYWQGTQIITLGTEAFKWFEYYSNKDKFNAFWSKGDSRYESSLNVTISTMGDKGKTYQKNVTIYPLPHPSPLNQKYYNRFPSMLENTLSRLAF